MTMKTTLSILQGFKSFQDHLYLSSHLLLTADLCMDRLGITTPTWIEGRFHASQGQLVGGQDAPGTQDI